MDKWFLYCLFKQFVTGFAQEDDKHLLDPVPASNGTVATSYHS